MDEAVSEVEASIRQYTALSNSRRQLLDVLKKQENKTLQGNEYEFKAVKRKVAPALTLKFLQELAREFDGNPTDFVQHIKSTRTKQANEKWTLMKKKLS